MKLKTLNPFVGQLKASNKPEAKAKSICFKLIFFSNLL